MLRIVVRGPLNILTHDVNLKAVNMIKEIPKKRTFQKIHGSLVKARKVSFILKKDVPKKLGHVCVATGGPTYCSEGALEYANS